VLHQKLCGGFGQAHGAVRARGCMISRGLQRACGAEPKWSGVDKAI